MSLMYCVMEVSSQSAILPHRRDRRSVISSTGSPIKSFCRRSLCFSILYSAWVLTETLQYYQQGCIVVCKKRRLMRLKRCFYGVSHYRCVGKKRKKNSQAKNNWKARQSFEKNSYTAWGPEKNFVQDENFPITHHFSNDRPLKRSWKAIRRSWVSHSLEIWTIIPGLPITQYNDRFLLYVVSIVSSYSLIDLHDWNNCMWMTYRSIARPTDITYRFTGIWKVYKGLDT